MTQIISKEYKAFKETKNLSLDEIFIKHGGQYYALSKLNVYTENDAKEWRKIKSLADFKRQVEEGNVFIKRNFKDVIGSDKTFIRALNIPKQYESDCVTAKDESIYHGLKRISGVERQDKFNTTSDEYVYVQIKGEITRSFYNVEQIGYYEAGMFVSLLGKQPSDFENKNLFTREGKYVSNIYTGCTFTFTKAIAQEKIDETTLTREMYELDTNGDVVMITDKSGNQVPKILKEKIDGIYSEQTFRKVDGKAKLEVKNFEKLTGGNGEYVLLKLKGESTEERVSKDSLYEMDELGKVGEKLDSDAFKDKKGIDVLVGKRLFVKNGDEYLETEPLTLEQVLFTYSATTRRIPSTSKEDIMADNALLSLKDGRFIKEKTAVRPIAYEFTDQENYDALCVTYRDTEGSLQAVILPKNTFDKSPIKKIDNNITVRLQDAYRVKKSVKTLSECDVIQTSNNPNEKAQKTYLLKQPSYNAGKLETQSLNRTNEEIEGVKLAMIEAYKKGEYQLNEVIDNNGKLVKLDKKPRFIETDYAYEEDYANKQDHYDFLKMNPLELDAKTGKLVGGPHFDVKAANKEGFRVLGDWARTIGQATFSLPGVLIMAAFPPLAVGLVGGIVGMSIGIPFVNWIRSIKHNHRRYDYKDKTAINRRETAKKIDKELQELYEKVKKDIAEIKSETKSIKDKTERKSVREEKKEIVKRKFLRAYEEIDQKMKSLHTSKYYSEFVMKEGKANVNEGNASLMSEYRKEMSNLKDRIKVLKKVVKKDSSKQAELDMLQAEYEGKLQFYKSRGKINPKDKSATELEQKAESMRGLVLAKMFGKTDGLSEQEKEMLKAMEYDHKVGVKLSRADRKKLALDFSEEEGISIKEKTSKLIEKITKSEKHEGKEFVIESRPVESVDTTSSPTQPEPPIETGPQTEPEPPVNTVKTNQIKAKKIILCEKELKNLLKAVDELKKLDDIAYGPDEDMSSDYDKQVDEKVKYIKERWHLIERARKSKNYEKYKKYNSQMLKALKYMDERIAGLDLGRDWTI